VSKQSVESKVEDGAVLQVRSGDIHCVLSSKGGVGKTFVASLIAQYWIWNKRPIHVLDMDQSNMMLARVPDLKAEQIRLLTDGKFDSTKLDAIIRRMVATPDTYLIDVGASTFQNLWHYFFDHDIFSLIRSEGRRIVIHSVVCGGQELVDTVSSFVDVCKQITGRQVVVWVNPIRGAVEANGKEFLESKAFTENEAKVLAVVRMPKPDESVEVELRRLGQANKSLLHIETDNDLDFLTKHRLKRHRDSLFEAMAQVWEAVDAQS
jgi:hypothetical protein